MPDSGTMTRRTRSISSRSVSSRPNSRKKAEMMLHCAQALTWERRWRAKWVPSRPFDLFHGLCRGVDPNARRPSIVPCSSGFFFIHHNEGYDPTPCPATALVDTAFNLWIDFTDELIFLANTADPPALRRSMPLAPEASIETGDRNVSYSDSMWDRHENWNDNGAWSSDAERASIPVSSWQRPTNVDVLQKHDPWRPQHWQDVFDASPPQHRTGPCPSSTCQPPPPPCHRRKNLSAASRFARLQWRRLFNSI